MSLLYCYGVVGEKIDLVEGFEGQLVHCMSFHDLFAVVSLVSEEGFSQQAIDRKIKDMQWLADHAALHESVVDAVRQQTTIVPMKFCTLFQGEAHVLAMLGEKYADLKENLARLAGRVEIGVKVFADSKALAHEVHSPEIDRLRREKLGKTPGVAYFAQQKIDNLVREKVRAQVADGLRRMYVCLTKDVDDARKNALLRDKEMVLNAVFLLRNDQRERFEQRVKLLQQEFGQFTIRVAGPFTPYNFVR